MRDPNLRYCAHDDQCEVALINTNALYCAEHKVAQVKARQLDWHRRRRAGLLGIEIKCGVPGCENRFPPASNRKYCENCADEVDRKKSVERGQRRRDELNQGRVVPAKSERIKLSFAERAERSWQKIAACVDPVTHRYISPSGKRDE
jgi:hypothetical protein